MSWTRFGQLSAETQSLADVAGLGGNGYTIQSTQAFTGLYSYRCGGTNKPMGFAGALGVAARCGFQFRPEFNTSAGVIGFLVDGASLVFVFNSTTNDVTMRAGYAYDSTSLRTTPITVNVPSLARENTWMHIGMVAYMAASGGFASLYVDGIQVATWTGDTQLYRSGATTPRTSITGIYAAGSLGSWPGGGVGVWGSLTYIDDFYAEYWTGESAPTDAPVPSRKFYPMYATANGAAVAWTPSAGANFECVDEAPPTNDTDYVQASGAGVLDRYTMSDVTLDVDYQPRAVIVLGYGKKADAGIDSRLRLSLHDGAAVLEGHEQPLPTSYGYIHQRWATDFDGEPWTMAAINALEFGYQSAGDFE